MELRKGNAACIDCQGIVTILTQDRVIFQGEIIKNNNLEFFSSPVNCGNRVDFILLELRCFPALLRDNAEIKVINPPIYQPNNTIRINVDEIVSVGPSGACLEEENEA